MDWMDGHAWWRWLPRPLAWRWLAPWTADWGWWAGIWSSHDSPWRAGSGRKQRLHVSWPRSGSRDGWLHDQKDHALWPLKAVTFRYFTSSPPPPVSCGAGALIWQWWKKLCKCWSWKTEKQSRRRPVSQHTRNESRANLSVDGGCQVSGHLEQRLAPIYPFDLRTWMLRRK